MVTDGLVQHYDTANLRSYPTTDVLVYNLANSQVLDWTKLNLTDPVAWNAGTFSTFDHKSDRCHFISQPNAWNWAGFNFLLNNQTVICHSSYKASFDFTVSNGTVDVFISSAGARYSEGNHYQYAPGTYYVERIFGAWDAYQNHTSYPLGLGFSTTDVDTYCEGTVSNLSVQAQPSNAVSSWSIHAPTISSNGILFDGTDDRLGFVPPPGISDAFTICVWAKCTGQSLTGSTSFCWLVDKFNGYSGGQRNRFLLQGNFQKLYFQPIISSTSYDIFSDTFSSVQNQISLFSVTYDGSEVNMYLNGSSVLATPYSLSGTLDSNTRWGTLGWGAESDDYYFNGTIYSYMVYDRALTSSEISQNYDALKNRFGL